MQFLKTSTAVTIQMGPFVDETDGFTAETGLTIARADVRLSKADGAFAQKNETSSATHDENGWYQVPLDTADTNTAGRLLVAVHVSGARPVFREFWVTIANVYNSLAGADQLKVDTVEISSDSAAADGLEAFVEALGTDDKVLISADAQDLSATLDVNTKTMTAGAITADAITAGSITAAKIGVNAIGASELADDAVQEIADQVWDELQADHVAAGSFGEMATEVASVLADTDELQTDDVPALIAALNDPTAAAIADQVWDELLSEHTDAGSAGATLAATTSAGAGAISFTYTLTSDVDGSPIGSATVWVTTDEEGTNVVASGTTSTLGEVTFYLDAGTYYVWREKAGWNFTNPDTEAIS